MAERQQSSTTTRSAVFGQGAQWLARMSLRAILIAAGLWLLGWVVAAAWPILLPILLALIVASVLWPPVRWLTAHKVPAALAVLIVLLAGVGIVAAIISAIAPSVVSQSRELADQATAGIYKLQHWAQGPPLNISDDQLRNVVASATEKLQESSSVIANGFFSGVGTVTSVVITGFTAIVLVFFFLKDGPRFLPWLDRKVGAPGASHVAEVLRRMWTTLSGFIRTQAIVSAVDAVFIGAGLLILGVPLAIPLAIVTFLAGFVPIVGAVVAGALAVLIALVANGVWIALAVLGLILLVQQLEGNVLQPWLQSKSMNLHPTIVLLAVMLGGSIFGIVGAFLAVPAAACMAVLLRYLDEQISLRATTEPDPDDDGDSDPQSAEQPEATT